MGNLPPTYKLIWIVEQSGAGDGTPSWNNMPIKEGPLYVQPSQHMDQQRYRNIQFGSTLGSDCMGTVASPPNHSLYRQDMLVYPAVNWLDNASGGRMFLEKRLVYWGDARHGWGGQLHRVHPHPRRPLCAIAGPSGRGAPPAVPLACLTDFRAVFQKGQVLPFSDVLIIGIGGGVAIWALQFCVTVGTRVWVTSSSKHIIKQACQLGAKGGVNSAKVSTAQPAYLKTFKPFSANTYIKAGPKQ
ncbi:hypothetical protein PCASD_15277 [Puccinia coronata f. sp. avenae]|uniref:Alcohol dehydrogenase-like C-terminal domain-containing protein n=1 Tax=Puccinia coronata f. sp. avenae TaxID=200324 RepID=A0A2N5UGN7_9BASI|nr:hypothetical protein PCASD_15277 [Puccinia coronata f. sp. avenae]